MACGPGGFWTAYEGPSGNADGGSRGGVGASAGEPPWAAPSLQAVSSCDELLEAIQLRLFTEVRMRQEYARAWDGAVSGEVIFGEPQGLAAGDASYAPPSAFSWLPPAGRVGPGDPTPDRESGDLVRLDGSRLYVLDDLALNVVAIDSSGSLELLAALPVEGRPLELVARDGRVAVLSRIAGALPGTEARFERYAGYTPEYTKLTLVDAREASPRVLRELYAEGTFYYARRRAGWVSAGIQQFARLGLAGPSLSYVDLFGRPYGQAAIDVQIDAWAAETRAAIEESRLEDYLPTRYERVAGELLERPLECASVLVPPVLPVLGMTSEISVDLEDEQASFGERSVPGYSASVYADEAAVVLQRSHYDYAPGQIPRVLTQLHLFERADDGLGYVASGELGGLVVRHPYSIDVSGGIVRAASYEELYAGRSLDENQYLGLESRVLALGVRNAAGGPVLAELGRVVVGSESHTIYSTRFWSDRALLVTWPEQPAELLLLDLADPRAPAVAGRLAPQSYSSVFVPLPGDRFLSVSHAGALYQPNSLALQLFDTSALELPRTEHQLDYPYPSTSEATFDGRALAMDPTQGHLAFSIQDGSGASWLEVVRLSDAGFASLGRVAPVDPPLSLRDCLEWLGGPTDPETLAAIEADPVWKAAILEECSWFPPLPSVRRGLFLGDSVLSVTRRSVAVHALNALDAPPTSQIDFPRD